MQNQCSINTETCEIARAIMRAGSPVLVGRSPSVIAVRASGVTNWFGPAVPSAQTTAKPNVAAPRRNIGRVSAIYSKETGHGMGFELEANETGGTRQLAEKSTRPVLAVAGNANETAGNDKSAAVLEMPKNDGVKRPKLTVVK